MAEPQCKDTEVAKLATQCGGEHTLERGGQQTEVRKRMREIIVLVSLI